MAKKEYQATAKLFLDVSDAKSDAKQFISDLKQQLSSIETAADKMTVFKDLVSYIAMIDKNLANLIAKNGNAFKHMFDGLDSNVHNQFEELFGISGENLKRLDMLREKVASITDGSKVGEVRKVAEELNKLFVAVGKEAPINIDDIKKKATSEQINNIKSEFINFEKLWAEKVSGLKDNFNLSGIGIGSFSEGVQNEIKKLQDQITELKALRKELDSILQAKKDYDNFNPLNLEFNISQVEELINKYKELDSVSGSLQKGTKEYYKNLAEKVKIGLQLSMAQDSEQLDGVVATNIRKIIDSDSFNNALSEFESNFQNISVAYDEIIQNTQQKIKDTIQNLTFGVENQDINDSILSYSKLNKLVSEYYELKRKASGLDSQSDEYKNILNRQRAIQDEIQLAKQLNEVEEDSLYSIFDDMEENDTVESTNVLTRLCDLLGVKIPSAAESAGSAVQGVSQQLKAFYDLTDEIRNKSFDFVGDATDNLKIGEYIERLNSAKAALDELRDQGQLTAEQIDQVNSAFNAANARLVNSTVHYSGYGYGRYDYSYSEEYEDAIRENDELRQRNSELEDQLKNRSNMQSISTTTGNETQATNGVQVETAQLEELLKVITAVKSAVEAKTTAFREEAGVVDSVVNQEIASLERLNQYLNILKTTIQSVFSGNNKKIGFHYGNLEHYIKTGEKSENFKYQGDSLRTGNWGSFGTGIYYLSDPNAFVGSNTVPQKKLNNGQKFYAMDLSKYNLYMAQTSEQAESLYNFLNKLQKFVLSASNYRGFDEELQGVNVDTLYQEFQSVFKDVSLPIETLQNFINKMRGMVAGLDIDKNWATFENVDEVLGGSDNIPTRFMKSLGYQGVDTSGTSWDKLQHGSVIYDLDQANAYFKEFSSLNDLLEYYNQNVNQAATAQSGLVATIDGWIEKLKTVCDAITSIPASIGESTSALQSMASVLSEMATNAQTLKDNLDGVDNIQVGDVVEQKTVQKEDKPKFDVIQENITKPDYTIPNVTTESEAAQLDALLEKINAVKAAVDTKTQAFEEEYVTVDGAVEAEIASLRQLEEYLIRLQGLISSIFTGETFKVEGLDGINNSNESNNGQSIASILQTIDADITSIYGVLEAYTGIKSDAKDSINQKEPVANRRADQNVPEKDATNLGAILQAVQSIDKRLSTNKPEDTQDATKQNNNPNVESYAYDRTVQGTNRLIGEINSKLGNAGVLSALVNNLGNAVTALQNIAQGITPQNNNGNPQQGNGKKPNPLTVDEQAKQAYDALGKSAEDASVRITKTGNQAITTTQKVGAEVAKVVKATVDGAATTTLAMSNANKLAMEKTKNEFEKFNQEGYFGYKFNKAGVNPEAQTLYSDYIDTYNKLQKAMQDYDSAMQSGLDTTNIQSNIDALQSKLGSLETQLVAIANKSKSFLDKGTLFGNLNSNGISNSADSLKQLITKTESLAVAFRGVYDDGRKVIYDVLDNGIIKSYAVEVDEATGNVRKMELSELGLVNAMQNVNKAAKQRKELDSVLGTSNDVNKNAALITNYEKAKSDLDNAVQTAWTKAKQNGGIISQVDLDSIYAMSQEVMRLGSAIQSGYKKIANLRASGGIFNQLGGSVGDSVESRMRQYLNNTATTNAQSVTNIQYDSATKTMTADLVDLSGAVTKVRLEYNELFDGIKTSSLKSTQAIDEIKKKMNSLDTSVNNAVQNGLINKNLQQYTEYEQAKAKFDKYTNDISVGNIRPDDASMQQWRDLRQAVLDAGEALLQVAANNKAATNSFNAKKNSLLNNFANYKNKVLGKGFMTKGFENELGGLETQLGNITDESGLAKWEQSFAKLKNSIELAKKSLADSQKLTLGDLSGRAEDIFKSSKIDKTSLNLDKDQTSILAKYKEIQNEVAKCALAVKNGEQISTDAIENNIKALMQEVDAYKQKNNIVNAQKAAPKAQVIATQQGKFNVLQERAQPYIGAGSTVVASGLAEYEAALTRLKDLQNQFKSGQSLTADQQAQFEQLKIKCNEAYTALKKIIDASDKFNAAASDIDLIEKDTSLDAYNDRAEALRNYVQETYGASAAIGALNGDATKLTFTIKNGDGTITNMTASLNAARTAIGATAGETKKATTAVGKFVDELKGKTRGILTYLLSMTGFQEVWQQVRNGIQYVRDIDLALTELKKVTNETDETYNAFLQTTSKTAGIIGTTVSEFTNATADFARLGYDLTEASNLAEAASIYKNVGDGITDISQASESIISTMKAFGIEANDAMSIVDRFNEVGNNFAISSTGIGEAMQRSASALYEAGNTIDESIALITAANSVIQNPEQVGTALKTLSLRLRGTKVELEEAGEDVDGMAESTSQLQAKLKALTHGKVDIMIDANAFKNPTQILREMASAWKDMTDIERSGALELMGGKRQANILASIIKNFDTVEKVIETSSNSAGSALKENETYLDSIQGKIDQFKNSLQTMWMNFINAKAVKFIVDLGTGLIKLIDKIGVLKTALAGAGVYFFAIKKNNPATMIKDLITSIQNYNNIVKQIGAINSMIGPVQGMSIDQFNTGPVNAYAAAVSALTAKQQAATLAASGLNAEQIKAVLTANGLDATNIKLAMSEAGVAQAKTQNTAATGLQIAAAMKQQGIQLSQNAMNFLLEHSTEEVTKKVLAQAVAKGTLEHQDAVLIMRSMGIVAANKAQAFSWTALGTAIKGAFMFNPVGMILTIATTIAAIAIPVFKKFSNSAKELSEEVERLGDTYKTTRKELSDNIETLSTPGDTNEYKSLIDEFEQLTKGVNKYGENISLTSDEYVRYKEICDAIVGINPDIAAGYDSATEAIGNNAGILRQLIELQKEEARLKAAEYVSYGAYSDNGNFEKMAENAINEFNTAQNKFEDAASNLDSDNSLANILANAFNWDIIGQRDVYGVTKKGDLAEYIMEIIGFSPDEINSILESYYDSIGQFDYDTWVSDYADKIVGSRTKIVDALEKANLNISEADVITQEKYAAKVLENAGYDSWKPGSNNDYNDIIKQYTNKGKFDYSAFKLDYADEIAAYNQKFLKESTDDFNEFADGFKTISKNMNDARDGMIDAFLQVPYALKDYENLSTGEQSFITEWIKNSELFKIDENTTQDDIVAAKQVIIDTIDKIANDEYTVDIKGKKVTAQTILDQMVSINPAEVNYEKYKTDMQANINNLWKAIGAENNTLGFTDKNALAIALGYEFVFEEDTEGDNIDLCIKRIAEITGQTEDEIRAWVDKQPAIKLTRAVEFYLSGGYDAVDTTDGKLSIDDAFGMASPVSASSKTANVVSTYSQLSDRISSYNDVLNQTNEVSADNIKITQEYKDSLTELGISTEDLNECFDDNDTLVVKNSKLLKKLVSEKKKEIAADVKLAKQQSQLEYYDLVNQLNDTLSATENLTDENINAANSLLSQIDSVQRAIYQYQLLENSLLGAANAFDEFAKAQDVDAQNTYGDSYVEMAQTIYDAYYKTGEVGTEAVRAAVEALIDPSVYAGLERGSDAYNQAIYDAFNKTVLPTLTLDDDTLSIDFASIEKFVKNGLGKIFTGTDIKDFDLKEGLNLEEAAEAMGMTATQLYAMLAALKTYTGKDFLSEFDDSLSGDIMETTNQIENLNREKLALLKEEDGATKNADRIKEINKELATLNSTMQGYGETAHTTWQEFSKNDKALQALAAIENKEQALTQEMAKELGINFDENSGKTVQQIYDELLLKQEELGVPTDIVLQLASENIQSEIDDLEKQLQEDGIDVEANVKLNPENGEWEVINGTNNAKLQEYVDLLNEQQAISTFLESGLNTTETYLSSIEGILQAIANKIGVEKSEHNTKEKQQDQDSNNQPVAVDVPKTTYDDKMGFKEEQQSKQEERKKKESSPEDNQRRNDLSTDIAREERFKSNNREIVPEPLRPPEPDKKSQPTPEPPASPQPSRGEIPSQYENGITLPVEKFEVEKAAEALDPVTVPVEEFDTNSSDMPIAVDEPKTSVLPEQPIAVDIPKDPLEIKTTIEKDGIEGLKEINELQNSIQENSDGTTVINENAFKSALQDVGYTEDTINELIAKIQEYSDICTIIPDDPFGIQGADTSINNVTASLDELGIAWNYVHDNFGNQIGINIEVKDLITALQEKGWTTEQISAYLQTLSNSENGLGIQIDGKINVDKNEIDEAIKASDDIPESENISISVNDSKLRNVESRLNRLDGKTVKTYVDTYETTYVNRIVGGNGGHYSPANGTAHAQGTAFKGGDWRAKSTDKQSLVGELGTEILVRDGRWQTIGENGAEFTEVKKGDIIFNHKQTEELLKNGYVTGRGKAFAEGTAYGGTPGDFAHQAPSLWTPAKPNRDKKKKKKRRSSGSGSSSSAEDTADIFDWFEVRLEEINEQLDLMNARLENAVGISAKNSLLDQIINVNKNKLSTLRQGLDLYNDYANKLLEKIPEEYRRMAQDGAVAIEEFAGDADEQTLEAINNYREWAQRVADLTQQMEELNTEISTLARQKIDNIAQEHENRRSLRDSRIDQYEAYNSLLETDVGFESASIYQAMIDANRENISILQEQRDAMQAELDAQVEAGNIEKYSQDWYDVVNDIAAVDTEIIGLRTDIEDYQDSINELHWEKFDLLLSKLKAVSSEAKNLIDVLSNKDLVDKDTGEWTNEGITSLGLYAQQMEAAEIQAKKYEEEIRYLNNNWERLGYTEQEYIEKLDELKSGQYDAIQSYYDARDAIVDLNKERVDAIKKGIQKEIDAYEELINKKKEELSTEKDLYDFQKSIKQQQKNIADIERKLAALSSDNSASARAQRARLQAELAEAQQELQDMYYDRSVSDQQDALDGELENFRDTKDDEMEGLDEYLENTEQVVADSLAVVQANTDTVYQTLTAMGQEYGLSITESLTSPWQEGESAIQAFSETFGISMSATADELRQLETEFGEAMLEIERSGVEAVESVGNSAGQYTNAEYTEPSTETPSNPPSQEETTETNNPAQVAVGSKVKIKSSAKKYGGSSSNVSIPNWVKEKEYTVKQVGYNGKQVLLKEINSWVKISDLEGYAKGTTSIDKDQLALIDELGEELVINVQNGKLKYMSKGSGVIPADLTSNLMEWGAINPQDMIERNRPSTGVAPSIINNNVEFKVDASIGTLLKIDEFNGDDPDEVLKMINKALDQHTKNLNSALRRYTR